MERRGPSCEAEGDQMERRGARLNGEHKMERKDNMERRGT